MATIVIADDDPSSRDVIFRALSGAGHEVWVEADGVAALRQARERRPDVVIVDWMMPELSGVQVCRAIRKDGPIQDTHLIMTSAMTQNSRVREAYEAGADDFLAKPFSPADLVQRIQAEFPDHTAPPQDSVSKG